MVWSLEAMYGAAGEAYNTHTENHATGVTATGGVNILNDQQAANALTLANVALGDYVGIDFFREGTHVSDTLGNQIHLLGLIFSYTANQ